MRTGPTWRSSTHDGSLPEKALRTDCVFDESKAYAPTESAHMKRPAKDKRGDGRDAGPHERSDDHECRSRGDDEEDQRRGRSGDAFEALLEPCHGEELGRVDLPLADRGGRERRRERGGQEAESEQREGAAAGPPALCI